MTGRRVDSYANGRLSGLVERWRLSHAARHLQQGASVLDLGCGTGDLVRHLPHDTEYVGVDTLESRVALARVRFPDKSFVVCDIEQADPLSGWQFDAVALLAVLEHMADPVATLALASRHLSPQGRIVVTTPAPQGHRVHNLGARLGLLSRRAAEEHQALLGRGELEAIGRAAGLRISRYERFMLGVNQLACYSLGE